MTARAEQLKSDLSGLSAEDRAALARFLIESLDAAADRDVENAWEEELLRREQQILRGEAVGEAAEKVFRELRAKYS